MTQIPITLHAPNRPQTTGFVTISPLSIGARILKGILVGIVGIFLSALLIIFPLLHLVLVPLGLIATVIFAVRTMRESSRITGGTGQCPYCQAEVSMTPRKVSFPFLERCTECSQEASVVPTVDV